MSASTTDRHVPTATQGLPGPRRTGVPFRRLLHAELRKLVDTRAGRWLVIVLAGISMLAVVAVLIWGEDTDITYEALFGVTALPLFVLLPVLGIMAATAEWSQRTGLVTFTLEPHRGRVVAAKVLAAVTLGLVVVACAAVAAALAHLVGIAMRDVPGSWSVDGPLVSGLVLALVLYVLQGLAFGFVLLSTPLAIVAVLVLPTAWSVATGLVTSMQDVARWLDLSLVIDPLTNGTMTGEDWAHLGTAALLWIGLPMAVGCWRVLTREVK